jgi:hypothetical protein
MSSHAHDGSLLWLRDESKQSPAAPVERGVQSSRACGATQSLSGTKKSTPLIMIVGFGIDKKCPKH